MGDFISSIPTVFYEHLVLGQELIVHRRDGLNFGGGGDEGKRKGVKFTVPARRAGLGNWVHRVPARGVGLSVAARARLSQRYCVHSARKEVRVDGPIIAERLRSQCQQGG